MQPNGFVTQIQDLISDSNKDFVIGSSSVIINDSENEINLMAGMINPMSNLRKQPEEIPPLIVSGDSEQNNLN